MKRTIAPVVLLALILATAPGHEAQGGVFRKKDRSAGKAPITRIEMPEGSRDSRRFDRYPEMTFAQGVLRRGAFSGWKLDGTELSLREDCVMTEQGVPLSVLEEGRTAVVTGAWKDGVLVAYGVAVQPVFDAAVPNPEVKIKPSDSDPSVGEVISKPY
ncbi:MAG: hypothetical protein IPP62_17445 [bacterium]|nr:hypothetical protein [bacterium]